MIMASCGGWCGVWAQTLADSTWHLLPTSGNPPGVAGASIVFDSRRERLVAFGGYRPGIRHLDVFNEVWVMPLAGDYTWIQLTPHGTPPSPRYSHSAAYDSVDDRMVIFGGDSTEYSGGESNDTWALDFSGDSAWVRLAEGGLAPSPRSGALAAIDVAAHELLLFGGGNSMNDLWSLSLDDPPTWSPITPTNAPPLARAGGSLIFDTQRRRLLLYGGGDLGWETWSLTLGASPEWIRLGDLPRPKGGPGSAYDPVTDQLIVFSGAPIPGPGSRGDVWAKDLRGNEAWTQLHPSGLGPLDCTGASAVMDPVGHRMIVFGGYGLNDAVFGDTWELQLGDSPAWMQIPQGLAPGARWAASAIYDPVRRRMILFGGVNDVTFMNDVWALSLDGTPTWTQLHPAGEPPFIRSEAVGVYDPVRDRMLVFGGRSPLGEDNAVHALSFTPDLSWSEISAPPGLGGGAGDGAVYDPVEDQLIVINGDMTVWTFALFGTPHWTKVPLSGPRPVARTRTATIYDAARRRVVLFGGYNPGAWPYYDDYNDGWTLALGDVATPADAPLDVPRPAKLSIAGLSPNPARADMRVRFTIGSSQPAVLAVFDISGRKVFERRVEPLGEGEHVINITADRALPSGMYTIRLTQGPAAVATRGVLIR